MNLHIFPRNYCYVFIEITKLPLTFIINVKLLIYHSLFKNLFIRFIKKKKIKTLTNSKFLRFDIFYGVTILCEPIEWYIGILKIPMNFFSNSKNPLKFL